ncbi:hypothetical protein [Glycomyces buryatensis]|uniref:DUF1963 domain-containing protein n=1 Tax=Glycomyces buryatensis TaxID=2570927 RepID=A0A4S8QCZ9_9ACTN|nr:hypothetical protein [Glycomyces buryatensis]THV40765.1 hypothetical protein FAB82_14025 [Glycomyces buryatensis]
MRHTDSAHPRDIAVHLPELAAYAKSAVRLRPRPGTTTVHESSIGGPLLWPADESWPVCELEHDDCADEPVDHVRAERRYLADRDRRKAAGEELDWDAERLRMKELRSEHSLDGRPEYDPEAPPPLVALAQLYYRDVPGLPWADRYDLLQVLWCPRDHPEADAPYCPAFQLRWRSGETIGEPLESPPVPVLCNESYLPEPCVIRPEIVTEYPVWEKELPAPLAMSITAWQESVGVDPGYWDAQSRGWKVMGYGGYSGVTDPYPLKCECGETQLPLFTAASGEDDEGTDHWLPLVQADAEWPYIDPVKVYIGRGYTLQLHYCPAGEDHPNRAKMF